MNHFGPRQLNFSFLLVNRVLFKTNISCISHAYSAISGVQKKRGQQQSRFSAGGLAEGGNNGREEAGEIILQEMRTRLSQRLQKNKLGKNDTNAHAEGGKGGQTPRWMKIANTHSEAKGSAQTHTWVAYLMAVLVCNWHWAFSLNLSSDHMCGCMHAHTHMEWDWLQMHKQTMQITEKAKLLFVLVCWEMIKGGDLFVPPGTWNTNNKTHHTECLVEAIMQSGSSWNDLHSRSPSELLVSYISELTVIRPAVLWASLRSSGSSQCLNECVGGHHLHGNQVLRESSQSVFAQKPQ